MLDLNTPNKRAKKSEKSSLKKKTVSEQIDELLDKISYEDLKQYIKQVCKDKHFRHYFTAHFAHLVSDESQEFYDNQIKTILSFAKDRYNYIEYSNANNAAKEMQEYLEKAQKQLEANNPKTAMMIACAVLENMVKALDYTDDSNGYFGDCIGTAIDILYDISENPNEKTRKELFDYCLCAYKKGLFRGWDWHLIMLSISAHLVENKSEASEIYKLLDNIVKDPDDNYRLEFLKAQNIRYTLIEKLEGEVKATQYLEQNLDNSDFRRMVIEMAIEAKNYEKAKQLAESGILKDDKKMPRLANQWRAELLKIAVLEKDSTKIIEIARYLFLHSHQEKERLYKLMKNHTENWADFVEVLLKDIKRENEFEKAQIYIWEEYWDRLLSTIMD